MLKTVDFDNFNSALDFFLIRTGMTIEAAKSKVETIEVPGADGVLDFTDYFGEVYYANRQITLEFELIEPMADFQKIYSAVQNALNGKRMKIVLSEDVDFYWMGRVSVNEWKSNGRVGKIVIECDCEPYKYRKFPTVKEFAVDGTTTVIFENLNKRVIPTFTFNAPMQVTFGDTVFNVDTAGQWSDARLAFVQGANTVTFTGNGVVSVEYQERGL